MNDKVPCIKCGKPVRATTAQRTKGLCAACVMRRVRETAETEDYGYALYSGLIQRVCHSPGGFDALSGPEKLYYSVALLRNEINNGGFYQYFFNSSGSYYSSIEAGLQRLGALQTLTLLREAKEIVFSGMPVPPETERRRTHMQALEDSQPELIAKLEALDQRFYKSPDDITPDWKPSPGRRGWSSQKRT